MKPEWKKAARTALQVTVSLLLASPVLLPALGLNVSVGVGAAIVAASGLLARVMSMPQLIPLFEKLGIHA